MAEENTQTPTPKEGLGKGALIAIVAVGVVVVLGTGYAIGKYTAGKTTEEAVTSETPPVPDEPTTVASASATATISATDETADWKTYTNSTYGFSFKYPTTWTQNSSYSADDRTPLGDTSVFAVSFEDPATKPSGDGPQNTQKNVFISIDSKSGSTALNAWLTSKFKKADTELADYSVGSAITMGGKSGYISNIGCCGGYDVSYVVENGGYAYSLGTNFDGRQGGTTDSPLAQLASTFQFTPVK